MTVIPVKHFVASFDVDAQNTFTPVCPDELPVPEGDQIVSSLNRQAEFAQYRVGSKDAHSPKAIWVADLNHPQFSPVTPEESNADIYWNLHGVPGTKGFELIEGLPDVTAYDYFIWKGMEPNMHPYGACYHDYAEKMSTGVIEFLKSKIIDTVLVGGLATDFCVKQTALQLKKAGFNVIINLSACRGIAPDSTAQAIRDMQELGIRTVNAMSEIKQDGTRPQFTR